MILERQRQRTRLGHRQVVVEAPVMDDVIDAVIGVAVVARKGQGRCRYRPW